MLYCQICCRRSKTFSSPAALFLHLKSVGPLRDEATDRALPHGAVESKWKRPPTHYSAKRWRGGQSLAKQSLHVFVRDHFCAVA